MNHAETVSATLPEVSADKFIGSLQKRDLCEITYQGEVTILSLHRGHQGFAKTVQVKIRAKGERAGSNIGPKDLASESVRALVLHLRLHDGYEMRLCA